MTDQAHQELARAARQEQFLEVIDRDEAAARFRQHLRLAPLGAETVPIALALNRILAADVLAQVDVPAFDRSNVDGFAVRAADTFGAAAQQPRILRLNSEVLSPGVQGRESVRPGTATAIATGGMLPRGADAVVMIEDTEFVGDDENPRIEVRRAVSPGSSVSFAGTDIGRGETVLRRGQRLTSREIGVLAAIGAAEVEVWRRPRVAVISTGDEIIPPGAPLRPGAVYDSNAAIVAAAVEELGGQPVSLGIVPDDESALEALLVRALEYDAVIVSGGTSKGAGDLSYRVVSRLDNPGIVAHGVALKPGKPVCLAVHNGKPVVVLPGFPTSAIFTFHEFVAPVLRAWAGARMFPQASAAKEPAGRQAKPDLRLCAESRGVPDLELRHGAGNQAEPDLRPGSTSASQENAAAEGPPAIRALESHDWRLVEELPRETVPATLPMRVNSERGRTEYVLVGLVRGEAGLAAYPMGKGSGSVTAFSRADGFITIPQQTEFLEAGSRVEVQLLGQHLELADLVAIGSHCVGLDYLLGELARRGFATKALHVGSQGGWAAARRSECDVAGVHLMDPETGIYNRHLLTPELELIPGYRRLQGIVYRRGDPRFEGKSIGEAVRAALADPDCSLVNRNIGSGTRVLVDRLLAGAQPAGYPVQAKSHNAVAAAVSQGRADWGVAIETVARAYSLAFIPLQHEHYDFLVPKSRLGRHAVAAFCRLLGDADIRAHLRLLGFG